MIRIVITGFRGRDERVFFNERVVGTEESNRERIAELIKSAEEFGLDDVTSTVINEA